MFYINKEQLRDKIHACFVGKNIGGTIGTPYEGKIGPHDVKGFSTKPGEPLPNDDLDLQLVWLCAIEQVGAKALNTETLSEYWIDAIPPHWNEYGTGKANLRIGLTPPLSGHFNNEAWRDSNGAWIRSEVWACLAPGLPHVAMKYALYDACIDHGKGEGTVAELFTASMQSLAFFESNVKVLLEKALTFIPEDSRVSRCVRLVMREYDAGTPWLTCREKILEETADMTAFQAPANIAYAVLGLLYGEGDFKKSILLAVNCGDDTDCTAATVGATLGIMGGTACIPADWYEYIGDRIIVGSIDWSFWFQPKTCTELTDRILQQLPAMFLANGYCAEYTEKETTPFADWKIEDWYSPNEYLSKDADKTLWRFNRASAYACEFTRGATEVYTVDYLDEPYVKPLTDRKIELIIDNHHRHPHNVAVKLHLPEGWTADYKQMVYLPHKSPNVPEPYSKVEVTIHVGERVEAVNRLAVTFASGTYAAPFTAPITLLG